MSVIRIEIAKEFKGQDVVLVAMDRAGVSALRTAIERAMKVRSSPTEVQRDERGVTYLAIHDGPSTLEIKDNAVHLRISPNLVDELHEKMKALEAAPVPSHHYLDLDAPVRTMVLSMDEYT